MSFESIPARLIESYLIARLSMNDRAVLSCVSRTWKARIKRFYDNVFYFFPFSANQRQLFLALKNKDLFALVNLLPHLSLTDLESVNGFSLLHYAKILGFDESLDQLFREVVIPQAAHLFQGFPLSWAIRCYIPLNQFSNLMWTEPRWRGNSVFEALRSAGKSPSFFWIACECGNSQVAQEIFTRPQERNVSSLLENYNGYYPLTIALQNGHYGVVEFLMEMIQLCHVNLCSQVAKSLPKAKKDQDTLLNFLQWMLEDMYCPAHRVKQMLSSIIADSRFAIDFLEILVKKEYLSLTPDVLKMGVDLSIDKNKPDCLEFFIKKGASLNECYIAEVSRDPPKTPLEKAIVRHSWKNIMLLINNGANLSVLLKHGYFFNYFCDRLREQKRQYNFADIRIIIHKILSHAKKNYCCAGAVALYKLATDLKGKVDALPFYYRYFYEWHTYWETEIGQMYKLVRAFPSSQLPHRNPPRENPLPLESVPCRELEACSSLFGPLRMVNGPLLPMAKQLRTNPLGFRYSDSKKDEKIISIFFRFMRSGVYFIDVFFWEMKEALKEKERLTQWMLAETQQGYKVELRYSIVEWLGEIGSLRFKGNVSTTLQALKKFSLFRPELWKRVDNIPEIAKIAEESKQYSGMRGM